MSDIRFDVTGIGNAIVDVIANADDAFLAENGIEKGSMQLVDADRAEELYGKMGQAIEVSGGSGANTIAGIASLGGACAYLGQVKNDQLGNVFSHDIKALGVTFPTPLKETGIATARCMIMVTPDAQRSMNTFLGASAGFGAEHIDESCVRDAKITYLEGYLFDSPAAKEAYYKAAGIAHAAGRKVALTLSDGFCVDRHRADFRKLVKDEVDILFANEAEILSLYETDVFDEALQAVKEECPFVALTRGEAGSVIATNGEVHVITAAAVEKVVDTTGAGDLYAAGVLFGIVTGRTPAQCGALGSLAAAEAISHYGPRPLVSLKELATKNGLL